MGYLLKEALKTLCGINQWSYAAFWKFSCQNPKLLIWEECYYEPASCYGNGIPEIPYQDYISNETLALQRGVTGGNKVLLLVNKMMVDNHVHVVGEGLVGGVAVSGNHQWILSENYHRENHPPEVLKDICLQFSAGMQTVAVVPILPYGVAQFGSYSTIAENIEFNNGVISLIHELGCVPGVLQSTNQELPLDSYTNNASSFVANALNYVGPSSQISEFDSHMPFPLVGEVQNEMQSSIAAFQAPNSSSFLLNPYDFDEGVRPFQANKSDFSFPNHFTSKLAKAEAIPSNYTSFCSSSTLTHASIRCTEQKILPDHISEGHFIKPVPARIHANDVKMNSGLISSCDEDAVNLPSIEAKELLRGISSNSNPGPSTASETVTSTLSTSSGLKNTTFSGVDTCSRANDLHVYNKFAQSELSHCKEEKGQNVIPNGFVGDDKMLETEDWCTKDKACFKSRSGDDLFDILGVDFKDKWLSKCWRSCQSDESAKTTSDTNDSPSKTNLASSETYCTSQGKIHPFAKESLDNTNSCSTTFNNSSCSSAATVFLPYGKFGVSVSKQGDLSGMTKNTAKGSVTTACLKEDSGIYSQGSSIYDPWMERSRGNRQSNSVTTGYSAKPHEPSKTNRKRLKPGESPRPRPKDRQMIQDRVKELREIVPNGAKCSIDALLERTIKHLLFLQSVKKHAEKLKQTAESKIMSKDGGLLLKDNLGGATWAYEVGSQSMACPIIVEDLNQPHQMLVEMLCEERGLFLEIADIIRGLGLTILKGLMETRDDKIWAHFTVEANRKVTRMEIFLSLVRLLEQNAKTGFPQSNNTTVHEAHQAAPVPASGGLLNDSIC